MSVEGDYSDEDTSASVSPALEIRKHARAQHNALERRRRDNIKDMYAALKDAVPGMQGERASRAVVLKKAIDLLTAKKERLNQILDDNTQLRAENRALEEELARLDSELLTNESQVNGSDRNLSATAVGRTSEISVENREGLDCKRRCLQGNELR
ncbi:hypothetical protein AB6A40_004704 [Gnathostoma spinigerum]|uniref:BHLH domain-containing protein n=1 Tax=Gnathostoma spinigerum TaxID=75299 RepID=A0ABD6EEE7_9BILA